MKRGDRTAKRRRQYRARQRRRDRLALAAFDRRNEAARPSGKAQFVARSLIGMFARSQFQINRAMRRYTDFSFYTRGQVHITGITEAGDTPLPGGATDRSQDSSSRELIVPVQIRSASPEGA